MTTKLNTNGQARRSLAEQIDRLDSVLDGLADGINDTVVAAVKEAVGAAVQAVLAEVLNSPELLARLAVAVPTATQPVVKTKVTWKQRWCSVRTALTSRLNAIRLWCSRRLQDVGRWTAGAFQQVRQLACYRNQLLVAAGVGMTVGTVAYMAGPWLAAAAGGIGGFATSLAIQFGIALRRILVAVHVH